MLPLLATKLNAFRHDYTLIDCGSKNSIPNYIQLLNKFRIPYVAVYDRDHHSHKDAQQIASADIASSKVESQIDSELGGSVILENDIEEEIGMMGSRSRSKPFSALAHITADGYAISDDFGSKIRTIYK